MALDVKVWPLFRYARVGDTVRWSVLGPFVEFTRTPERRDLRIRPVLWLVQHRGPAHDDRAEFLYPIASSRWEEGYQSFRLLLFSYRTSPEPGTTHAPGELPPPELWSSRFTLFPLIYYRRRPAEGMRFSFFPFYLDIDDFLGFDNVRAIMFPAYLRLREPRVERRYYGFFVSTVGGPDGRGFRVFPFYGTKEVVGRERTRYVLWPFHIRSERLVPGYGWETRHVDLPILATIDGPVRTSRAYGVFAHTHTIDEQRGIEAIGAPWPLYFRSRRLGESTYRIWRLVPFYGRSEDDGGITSRFYAWPAYRTKAQDVDAFHYRRDDVLLIAWRRQTLESGDTGRRERLLTVLGALRSERENARRFGQTPAVFDSVLPKNRGVLALWAPLYGIFRWDTAADGSRDWSLLWGLVAREHGHLRGPVHVDLGDDDGG